MKKRKFCIVIFIVSAALVLGELFARYYLGLGTPPLYIADSQIEYLLKPDYDVKRFGNRHHTNQFGMRSDPLPNTLKDNEFRVMVFGDSVLYGGVLIAQSDLATSILQNNFSKLTAGQVYVGNISAKSWGPGNWLAYAKKYGFFDADAIVLVISSHDCADNPTFEPLNPNTHPTEKPFSALTEGVAKYLPRYLPNSWVAKTQGETDHFLEPSIEDVSRGLKDLEAFLTLAKGVSEEVLVFQHWTREEVNQGKAKLGNEKIRVLCEAMGISPIQLEPYFTESIANGVNPYHDNIHLNQVGQELIARAILEAVPNKLLR